MIQNHSFSGGILILTLLAILSGAPQAVADTDTNTLAPAKPFIISPQAFAEADQHHMMDLLLIKTLRPGRDGGNPKSTHYANYDESKANPYSTLPDPLVTTPEMWWQRRRPEIVEDFDREIYGRVPRKTPAVNWEVTSVVRETNGAIPVITKKLIGHVDNASDTNIVVNIQLTLSVPAAATQPVPVVMQLMFDFSKFARFRGTNALMSATNPASPLFTGNRPTWQQQALARGWACATLIPTSIQADNGAGMSEGIIGLMNHGEPRMPEDWGALRAWAWGASRALDYFESDKLVDATRVAIEGHSRYGKAALVAMAYDPRFAIAYVSSSGEGGAKLHRRDWGEIVENLAASGEYHWMAGNFLKYAGPLHWTDLPVDSHELIALCAPRPVFISAGSTNGDAWVDAKGMFMAAAAAGPVYQLLGKKDLGTTNFPSIETGLLEGDIAFRQHSSGHTDGPNWPVFLQFAARYFEPLSAKPTAH